jgi:hypothetical protein
MAFAYSSGNISPLARQPILMHKTKYHCGVFGFCAVHARAKMICLRKSI